MQKLFCFFLTSGSKRRTLVASVALWLLHMLLDAHYVEMWRNSDLLENFDSDDFLSSISDYDAIEEKYTCCEHAVSVLESAIEDLEVVY